MNFSLIVNPNNFRPFDYNFALLAIRDYNTGYEKSLAVYDKISQTLGDLASAVEGSTKAKALYDEYLNRFNTAADLFYGSGMNINTAKELGALRKLYGTLIRLLEKANEARVKAAEYLRAKNKDDQYMHESLGTLDDWMDNPNRDIRGYSGTLLTGEISALSKAVGQSIANIEDDGRLDPFTRKLRLNNGFTREDVDKTVEEVRQGGINNVTDPIMRRILLNGMDSSGIYNWADESTRRLAEIIAAKGLYGGIGLTKVSTYDDKHATAELLKQKTLDIERQKRQWAKEDAEEKAKMLELQNNMSLPRALRHTTELSQVNKKIEQFKKAGFIEELPDGSLAFTDEGMKEIDRKVSPKSALVKAMESFEDFNTKGGSSRTRLSVDVSMLGGKENSYTPLKNFINLQLTPEEKDLARKSGMSTIEAIRQKNLEGSYDIYRTTEFDRPLDSTYGKGYLTQMISNSGLSELELAEDWDREKGQWKAGSKIGVDNLKGWHVSNVRYSQYGNTVLLSKEGEQSIRVKIPMSLNPEIQKDVINCAKAIAEFTELIYNNKSPVVDANGNYKKDANGKIETVNRPLTDNDKAEFDKQITHYRNLMDYFGAQIVRLQKSKTLEN